MLRLFKLLPIFISLAACGKMESTKPTGPEIDPFSLYASSLQLANKNSADLYFGDGRTVTYIWTLNSDEVSPDNARFPGEFKIDVKVNYQTVDNMKVATGYTFTNPRLQLFSGEMQVEVEGVVVNINGVKAQGTEPFLSARKTARGSDPTNLYSGSVTVNREAVSTADKVSVAFGYLSVQARTDNPPIPANPSLSVPNPYVADASFSVSVGNDSTARRWCLTADGRVPSSTGVPCPGFENNLTSNGWLTSRPGTFALANVGRALAPGESFTLYLWVANSDLKISRNPATAVITFDPTAPSTPAFSVALSATQLADLSIPDVNEPADWCVQDGATSKSVEDVQNCKFTPNKPAYVGLRGGGIRYVSVFARDRARNAARSVILTVDNIYGRISFAQLADPAIGARGVFANNCTSCHGTGGAQQSIWDATSYVSTVGMKAKILDRISNATSPMPPTGPMGDRDQALIRLWFTQTSTPVEQ